VADRHGERVGDIMRRRDSLEAEQQLHHLLDLRFLRSTVPDHGALDLCGRVLVDAQSCFGGGEQRHAARMSELQRAANVSRVKDVLDRHAVRPAFREQRHEAGVNVLQSFRESRGGWRCKGAADDEMVPAA